MTDLAALLLAQNQPKEAEQLERNALVIERKSLPLGHPLMMITLHNLSGLLIRANRLDDLITVQREILKNDRGVPTPNPLDIARTESIIGWLLCSRTKYTEAETFLNESLAIRKKALGIQDSATKESATALAGLFDKTGRNDQAKAPARHTACRRRNRPRPVHQLPPRENETGTQLV